LTVFNGGHVKQKRPKSRRLSEILGGIDATQPLTVGSLVETFGERAFGALMFVFAVPNIIPTPPGTSAILGLPLVILTFQLMIGQQVLWLPRKIRERQLSGSVVAGFAQRALPVLVRLEKILKPRLSLFARSDLAERLIGIVAFLLSVVLFLPIPLVNILPALAIACLAIGLAERDGVAVLLGYVAAIATAVLLSAVAGALWVAAHAFFRSLFGLG
jgi:hypothetical protein